MTDQIVVYSVGESGQAHIMPNFRVSEFACRDGNDALLVSLRLALILQLIRDHFARPVTINSAYRTKAYNKKIGGAVESQHLLGKAADITVKGVAPSAVADYAETLLPNTGGIGRYPTFTHIDVREKKSRWKG